MYICTLLSHTYTHIISTSLSLLPFVYLVHVHTRRDIWGIEEVSQEDKDAGDKASFRVPIVAWDGAMSMNRQVFAADRLDGLSQD